MRSAEHAERGLVSKLELRKRIGVNLESVSKLEL